MLLYNLTVVMNNNFLTCWIPGPCEAVFFLMFFKIPLRPSKNKFIYSENDITQADSIFMKLEKLEKLQCSS